MLGTWHSPKETWLKLSAGNRWNKIPTRGCRWSLCTHTPAFSDFHGEHTDMAAFALCHKFYLLLWILLLLWFNDWCPQPALLWPRFFVTLKTTDQELQENLAVFASHFPSLLTQSPLSNNGRKKIVSYFTVVASVWCHGMFFSLWCVWQISQWCLPLPSWIPWLYFQYQKVLAKSLACVL